MYFYGANQINLNFTLSGEKHLSSVDQEKKNHLKNFQLFQQFTIIIECFNVLFFSTVLP